MQKASKEVILASQSTARSELLRNAGLTIRVCPSRIDETSEMDKLRASGSSAAEIAEHLAGLKAQQIAAQQPSSIVIGADQVLECDGRIFAKPKDIAEARQHLSLLRGRTHALFSAAVIYENRESVWSFVGTVRMTMRNFSSDFLDDYLYTENDNILDTVGCYRLESRGAQLFSHVSGDYFTVLGLPLLEILGFLRSRRVGIP